MKLIIVSITCTPTAQTIKNNIIQCIAQLEQYSPESTTPNVSKLVKTWPATLLEVNRILKERALRSNVISSKPQKKGHKTADVL